jgi:hypothetical protein
VIIDSLRLFLPAIVEVKRTLMLVGGNGSGLDKKVGRTVISYPCLGDSPMRIWEKPTDRHTFFSCSFV